MSTEVKTHGHNFCVKTILIFYTIDGATSLVRSRERYQFRVLPFTKINR